MISLIKKNQKWFSLVMIVTMLATIVLPNYWMPSASAAGTPEIVAGWVMPTSGLVTTLPANRGNEANYDISNFSIRGGRLLQEVLLILQFIRVVGSCIRVLAGKNQHHGLLTINSFL